MTARTAIVDTRPKGRDSLLARFTSGAVPKAIAQIWANLLLRLDLYLSFRRRKRLREAGYARPYKRRTA